MKLVYYAENMTLNQIRIVYSGAKNDVVICQDIHSLMTMYYTLIVIKDRECAKTMLTIYYHSKKPHREEALPYIKCFTQNELLCFMYPYTMERSLASFLEGQMHTPYDREKICTALTMEALSVSHPYPLLYLILQQGEIHICKDNSTYFTPYFNLDFLDETKNEVDCTICCAQIILSILRGEKKGKFKSRKLIQKRLDRNAYHGIHELYRDIQLTVLSEYKKSLQKKIKAWFAEQKDILFRIFLIFCVMTAALTILVLLSQLFFGDIPLFRMFEHSFDVIGTESLQ